MTVMQNSLTLLITSLFILALCGAIVMTWGRRLPGKGAWLIWVGILNVLTSLGLDTGFLLKEPFQIRKWDSGWIWNREEIAALTVGVLQDPLGVAVCILATGLACSLLLNYKALILEPRPERTFSALAISTVGVIFAWISQTPWLSFAGLLLCIVGGFISLGSRWESESESDLTIHFGLERAFGMLLSFFGACMIASSRKALIFGASEVWSNAVGSSSTWIGAFLLVFGLFLQMQSFPVFGTLVSPSEIFPPLRVLLNKIFPAWASLALVFRLYSQFVEMGLFPFFGWFALGSSVLTVLFGLFQIRWKQGLGAWLASGFSLAFAFLAFSGPLSAMGLMIGLSLGSLVLSSVGAVLEGAGTNQKTKGTYGLKVAAVLGACAGTGMIGFISAPGGMLWITQGLGTPSSVAPFTVGLFFFNILGWKVAWNIVNLDRKKSGIKEADVHLSRVFTWGCVGGIALWILASLALIWTGTVSGNVLPGLPDQLFPSFFAQLFDGKGGDLGNSTEFISASSLYWSALLAAFFTSLWTSNRREDKWEALRKKMPRMGDFIANGYGVDQVFNGLTQGLKGVGRFSEKLVDNKIWKTWVPNILSRGVKSLTGNVGAFDLRLLAVLEGGVRHFVEMPAKALQFIQTGDVRWYLFFAICSGFALLLHFLKW